MRQVTVISFTPNQELHAVFHFPERGRPRKLRVVGSVLAQVNEFVGEAPFTATRYVIEPAFVFEERVALGTDYMDSPSVIAVPSGWADESRAIDEHKRRTQRGCSTSGTALPR